MAASIAFYFDFISPFSYFAIQRLPDIAKRFERDIAYHAVDLAVLKHEAGNTAPPTRNMPIKLRYMRADQVRWADHYGVPVKTPAHYDSSILCRGVFFAERKGRVGDYVARAFHKVWGEGGHMTDDALIQSLVNDLGWESDEFLQFTASQEATELYRISTQDAHRHGVFGVPTMMIGDEMWWGNDRLEFMEKYLSTRASSSGAD